MGRASVIDRATDRDAGIVDRSAEKCVSFEPSTCGIASGGAVALESVSGRAVEEVKQAGTGETQTADQELEIVSAQVWFQLSGPERQRFGHCFSLMVLKALGRRSCPFTEEQP